MRGRDVALGARVQPVTDVHEPRTREGGLCFQNSHQQLQLAIARCSFCNCILLRAVLLNSCVTFRLAGLWAGLLAKAARGRISLIL